MTISEIKKWAKGLGYDTIKDKDDGKYYWSKSGLNSPDCSGVATSVSKLAKAIYNHYTDNKWIDHQAEFLNNLQIKKITVSDYGS